MTFTFSFSSSVALEETSPLVCQLPTLPPPLCKPSYEDEWKKNVLKNQNQTVFGLAWQDRYLVAVTSSGNVCIWEIPRTDSDETETELRDPVPCQTPLLKVQVTGGCLSKVHFVETNQKVCMLLCGDEGVWGYDWKHWLQLINGTTAAEPKLEMCYRPHPCPYRGAVKINDFTVAAGENYILGAASDAFGGYKWDMETQKLLRNYPSAKKGELNTITCIDNSTVLMGGQDGIIGLWDCHADKLIDNIDLKTTMDKHPSLVVEKGGNTPSWDVHTCLSICHIVSCTDNWWTVCGGTAQHQNGGHVTSWHAPTRTLVAGGKTRETLQFASCWSPTNLLTLADEGVVTHWSQPLLERKHRAWCSPPSSFAAAHTRNDDDNNNMLAVGGVGNLVDIFDNMTDKLYSLSLTDTI